MSPRFSAALALFVAMLLTTGCGTDQARHSAPTQEDNAVGHIHGLGLDPAGDTLYVATHFGLVRVDDSRRASRVADRRQDTMAFTVVGPGHFLASGHPDPREDLPPHLGLIESTDAGQTWTPLALQGEADFHILEPAGEVLYAYDATSGRLLSTRDGRTFDEIIQAPLISMTSDPEATDQLIATGDQGQLVRIDVSGTVSDLDAPITVLLDTASDGSIIAGIDRAGVVRVSTDAAKTWREAGTIAGPPAAFTISDAGWFAATEKAVFRSDDQGKTWSKVL